MKTKQIKTKRKKRTGNVIKTLHKIRNNTTVNTLKDKAFQVIKQKVPTAAMAVFKR